MFSNFLYSSRISSLHFASHLFCFSNQKLPFQNILVSQESTPHEKLNLVVMRLIIILIKQYIMSILSYIFFNLGSLLINGNFNGVSGVRNRYKTK